MKAGYASVAVSRSGGAVSFRGVPPGTYRLEVDEGPNSPTTVSVAEGERKFVTVKAWFRARLWPDVYIVDARDPSAIEVAYVTGIGTRARPCSVDTYRSQPAAGVGDALSKLWKRRGRHDSHETRREALVVLWGARLADVDAPPDDPTQPILEQIARLERPEENGTDTLFDVTVVESGSEDAFGLAKAERPEFGAPCRGP